MHQPPNELTLAIALHRSLHPSLTPTLRVHPGKETYFLGIIDTLTSFNTKKKMEKALKIFKGVGVSVS